MLAKTDGLPEPCGYHACFYTASGCKFGTRHSEKKYQLPEIMNNFCRITRRTTQDITTMKIKESDIPNNYRTGKTKPAKNVAELIALLQALPPSLKISHGFGDKVIVGVHRINGTSLRLTLDEVD